MLLKFWKKNIKKWRVVLKFCAKIGGRKGASGILCNWKIGCKVDVWWIRKVKINEKLNSGTPPQTSQTAIIWGHTQLWFKVTRRVKWKKGNDLQCTLQVSLKKSSFRKKTVRYGLCSPMPYQSCNWLEGGFRFSEFLTFYTPPLKQMKFSK